MTYKMRLFDKNGAFHIQMPYLTGNIQCELNLNDAWLGVIKILGGGENNVLGKNYIVGDGGGGDKKRASHHPI